MMKGRPLPGLEVGHTIDKEGLNMNEKQKEQVIEILETQQEAIKGLQDMISAIADRLERLELFETNQKSVNQAAAVRLDGLNETLLRLEKRIGLQSAVADKLVAIQEERNGHQDALDHIQGQQTERLKGLDDRLGALRDHIQGLENRLTAYAARLRAVEENREDLDAFAKAEAQRQVDMGADWEEPALVENTLGPKG